jgi:hypothetical protein
MVSVLSKITNDRLRFTIFHSKSNLDYQGDDADEIEKLQLLIGDPEQMATKDAT